MNFESARLARREAATRSPSADPDQPALRRRRARPDEPHRVDLAGRQRPGRPQHHLRRSWSRPTPSRPRGLRRRRRRPAAGRDDLRHAQRQGRDLRARDAVRGARPPLAGDHLRHHHRRLRPHPVRARTTEAFWNSVRHARPLAVGLNCALGAEEMRPYIAELSRVADCFVSCYPNAGLPNAFGEYDETPDQTAEVARRVRATPAWSTSSAAAAAPRPTTSPRSPRSVDGASAARAGRARAGAAALRPRAAEHHRGLAVRQHRRAHQRHRLRASSAT